jgi:threonine dehydrogenase-like Zn-dependent dehydrogenase
MKAVFYGGVGKVSVESTDDPVLLHDDDAIVRVTAASICGTDVRFYWGTMSSLVGLQPGTALGHEFVGVIEETQSAYRGRIGAFFVPFAWNRGLV